MRNFIFIFFLATSLPAIGQTEASFVTNNVRDLKLSVAMATPECSAIYYVSKVMSVDTQRSSILMSPQPQSDGSQKNVIEVTLALRPQTVNQNSDLKNELLQYASEICAGKSPAIRPYLTEFQELNVKRLTNLKSISLNSWSFPGGINVVRMTFLSDTTSYKEIVNQLRYFSPADMIQLFADKITASLRLTVSYQAASDFAEKYFTERICTETTSRQCFAGICVPKHDRSCKDIPRMVQVLNSAQYQNVFVFERTADQHVSEEDLEKMEDQMLTRLMTSLYIETERTEMQNLTQITFGQLKKQNQGVYHDEATIHHFVENTYSSHVQVEGLDEFAIPVLKSLYSQITNK